MTAGGGGISRRPSWVGTVLYVPLLYSGGWLASRPLALVSPSLRPDQVNLAGAVLALVLLLLTLPLRLRRAWGIDQPWRQLGLVAPVPAVLRALVRGLLKALLLLGLVSFVLLITGNARWAGVLSGGAAANALALGAGVGFAEELLFRGWFLGELDRHLGANRALIVQAVVFALVHPWYRLPGLGAAGLLGGLVMLGLVLALQRRADGGVLWGAIGLHGGLVGGWFALQAGLLSLSPTAPGWMSGPGGMAPNPIGGLVGWLGLGALLWVRWRWWRRA
ncbi:CPBP family intramembrane metalloprotease [Cyanobium sp. FGCU-52]|nr:CPBP family intramembrane metalloprotease [Cyanobium sp. FGCU52]